MIQAQFYRMEIKSLSSGPSYDLWDDSSLDPEEAKRLSVKRQKKEPHFQKAVKLPHPGQSYNPAPEDHRKLLASVARAEIKYLRREEHLKKVAQVPKMTTDELELAEHNELVSGIEHLIPKVDDDTATSQEEHGESDEFCSDYDEADFDAMLKDRVVQEKRKTNSQRMRQLRDRLQRKQAKLRKLRNIRLSKFNSIKKIKKQLDEQDKLKRLMERRRLTKRRLQRFTQKFEPSDPIFCLPSELPTNLRKVKCPVDAMLRERMESFQGRNLVEPTSLQMRKVRYPRKKFDRRNADNKICDDLQYE